MDRELRARLEKAVLAAMESAGREPARWGIDDCSLWVANIVRDGLGYDAGAQWRGRYDSRDGAMAVLGRGGLGFAFKGLARRYGWRLIDPFEAEVGDPGLCLLPTSSGGSAVTAMVCRARGWWLVRGETGFSAVKPHLARLAWSLG